MPNPQSRYSHWVALALLLSSGHLPIGRAQEVPAVTSRAGRDYAEHIQPLLASHCYDCHSDGAMEGGFQLDTFSDQASMLADHTTWSKVLKNARAGVMPPAGETKPTDEQIKLLADWIKQGPFGIDPNDIDPGRVTIHRLNRLEYRNTIYQLLGIKYNTRDEFPPDAAGMGLDNIADLLTMSPLIMEKYLDAAEAVLDGAFPSESVGSISIPGHDIRGNNNSSGEFITFNKPPEITTTYRNTTPGSYRLQVQLEVVGLSDDEKQFIANYLKEQEQKAKEKAEREKAEQLAKELAEKNGEKVADPAAEPDDEEEKPRRRFGRSRSDGPPPAPEPEPLPPVTEAHFVASVQSGTASPEVIIDEIFSSQPGSFEFIVEQLWSIEPHKINFNIVMPDREDTQPQNQFFSRRGPPQKPLPAPHLVLKSLTIIPQATETGQEYFPGEVPAPESPELQEFVRAGLTKFGLRALRRPIDEQTLLRLADEVVASYQESRRFHDSLKPALAKLLCSPRFLFRIDRTQAGQQDRPWGQIDEYSLASRLSYFLWSGPPDDELLTLAGRGELRKQLDAQVARMIESDRVQNFIENFSGQWLQTRNVMSWPMVESAILERENIDAESPWLTESVRRLMQQEIFMYFGHVLEQDRSILEFIDSNYTFLNKELADYYNMEGVEHADMRLVELWEEHPRGGVITAGSTLLVTSTPNRTSPVKRGVFVLDNFLGLRPHDPPPDVPSVDAAGKAFTDHEPSFREMLELHRKDPLCASCHNLMDPIGLGLDSFNALGWYRETEFGQSIDTSGRLASGEEFTNINELKAILRTGRRQDFYRCLTDKMLTYALGRGLDYYDTESVDQIVERLEQANGRFSALLMGIIESSPFQQRRNVTSSPGTTASNQ